MMSRYKPRGWRNESYRHYLAAKGVKTTYMARRPEARLKAQIAEMNRLADLAETPSEKLVFQLKAQTAEEQLAVEQEKPRGLPQEPTGTFEGKRTPKEVVLQTPTEARLIDIRITRLSDKNRNKALNLRKEVEGLDEEITEKAEALRDVLPGDAVSITALRKKMREVKKQQGEESDAFGDISADLEDITPLAAEVAKLRKQRTEKQDSFDELIGNPRKFRAPGFLTKTQQKRKADRPLPRETILPSSDIRLQALEGLEGEQQKRARGVPDSSLPDRMIEAKEIPVEKTQKEQKAARKKIAKVIEKSKST